MGYTTILKEEATSAANQYFDLFLRQIKGGNVDFQFHLKEDLQYSSHCKEIISDYFRQFSQLLNFNPMDYTINRTITKKVDDRVKRDFFPFLKEEYLPRLKEALKDKKEELVDSETDLHDWQSSNPAIDEDAFQEILQEHTERVNECRKQVNYLEEALVLLEQAEWS